MEKPNIIALPTSQMATFCDVLGLGTEVQSSVGSMILALEEADFSKLEIVEFVAGKPRPANTISFEPDEVSADIVERRKAALGRT